MPTINVDRSLFINEYGRLLSDEMLEDLCFSFGVEVEFDDPLLYKFEIGANRYDLLNCHGLVRALGAFCQLTPPAICPINILHSKDHLVVDNQSLIGANRPYVLSCILRGVDLSTDAKLADIIGLQEKLHSTLGRRRRLVAIGLHDLKTISFPVRYVGEYPHKVAFHPLMGTSRVVMEYSSISNGEELMRFYEECPSIRPYIPLLSPAKWPLIKDSSDVILSQPPLINSIHTQLKLGETKDIFIELTGQCVQRLKTALTILCYNIPNKAVELVGLENAGYVKDQIFADRKMCVDLSELTAILGTKKDINYRQLLQRMLYSFDKDSNIIVPAYRSDVLHSCDIAEDLVIA
ncbi:hypothetical protein ACOME3_009266 [Neoechinorhynchus agilis]